MALRDDQTQPGMVKAVLLGECLHSAHPHAFIGLSDHPIEVNFVE